MEIESLVGLNNLEGIKAALKKDPSVSGVWDRLDSNSKHQFFHRITFQRGNTGTQVIIPQEGRASIIQGKIINKRRPNMGFPTRMTVFVSNNHRETFLEEREF